MFISLYSLISAIYHINMGHTNILANFKQWILKISLGQVKNRIKTLKNLNLDQPTGELVKLGAPQTKGASLARQSPDWEFPVWNFRCPCVGFSLVVKIWVIPGHETGVSSYFSSLPILGYLNIEILFFFFFKKSGKF